MSLAFYTPNGTNDYLRGGVESSSLKSGYPLSMMAWCRVDTDLSNQWQTAFSSSAYNVGSQRFAIGLNRSAANTWQTAIMYPGGIYASTTNITQGAWVQTGGVFRDSTWKRPIYNGAWGAAASTGSVTYYETNLSTIGSMENGGSFGSAPFNTGAIAHVAVFEDELPEEAFRAVYLGQASPLDFDPSYYWPLNGDGRCVVTGLELYKVGTSRSWDGDAPPHRVYRYETIAVSNDLFPVEEEPPTGDTWQESFSAGATMGG